MVRGRAEQPFALALQQLAQCHSFQRSLGHLTQALALIAEQPGFADRLLAQQLKAKEVAKPPAAPKSSLEDRLKAQWIQWFAAHALREARCGISRPHAPLNITKPLGLVILGPIVQKLNSQSANSVGHSAAFRVGGWLAD